MDTQERQPARKHLGADAAFAAATKEIAERNEAAYRSARKLRDVQDRVKVAERRARDQR